LSLKPGVTHCSEEQGRCGSCWAFATAAAAEGVHAIKTQLAAVSLSAQSLPFLDAQFWMGKVGILHCSTTVAFRLYLVKIVRTLTN
jgi:hypothetical protein